MGMLEVVVKAFYGQAAKGTQLSPAVLFVGGGGAGGAGVPLSAVMNA